MSRTLILLALLAIFLLSTPTFGQHGTPPTISSSSVPRSSSSSTAPAATSAPAATFSSSVTPSTTSTPGRSSSSAPFASSASGGTGSGRNNTNSTGGGSGSTTTNSPPPDVLLRVPRLSVGRIELDVDNLQAQLNLAANVASLVSINAGVAVSIEKVNLTIVDVEATVDLEVRLGHLVDIVGRVFKSLDLNPLLITAVQGVGTILDSVVGAVDGLLGSITQGGTTLNFLIDNLGNIVSEVLTGAGSAVGQSAIVGNYLQNMTYTGVSKQLSSGLLQKTYSFAPLNALVDIVFNTAGQVVQATVQKPTSGSGGSTGSTGGGSSTGGSNVGAGSSTGGGGGARGSSSTGGARRL